MGEESRIGRPVQELRAAVERFIGRRWERVSPEDVLPELAHLRQSIDLLELEFSRGAAAYSSTDQFEADGSVTPIDAIRHNCRMSGATAADRVSVGDELERLPISDLALRSGEIGFAHLTLIARTSAAVNQSPTARTIDEDRLLEAARAASVSRFRHICYSVRHAADPEGFAQDEAMTAEDRTLVLSDGENGRVFLKGVFDSAGAAVLRTALAPLVRPNGAHDNRLRDKRMADGLVELAQHELDHGTLPRVGNQRPHVTITVQLETLLSRVGSPAAEMEHSLPISSVLVERFACDPSVVRVLLDSGSAVVDVGRAKRVVSAPLRRSLEARDRHCRWPGCDRPASYTEAHHLVHWVRGGNTELSNLVLLCYRHHWMVHEGKWQIARTDDGRIITLPPSVTYSSIRGPTEYVAA